MKKIMLCAFVCALVLGCGEDNSTEPETKEPTEDSSFFFPLQVGAIWYYYEEGHADATRSVRVWDAITLDDTTYVLYGNKSSEADILYQDKWGRVYKRFNDKNLLWLDFSVDDGGTYHYKLSEKLDYMVTVTRRLTIDYDDQKFENCIQFDFEVPTIENQEETIILAPDVGIVKHETVYYTRYLKSWELQ
ncbi:hypothetical protein JW998_04435 [candidate division KSB1 bacterium]|nr:hypothetical protein [candidate division KSB1 bacterium]